MTKETRFTGRSMDYSLYRPDYPHDLINLIQMEFNLTKEAIVADIGAGTGKLSRLFLDNGNTVYCIEPNEDMRKQSMEDLSSFEKAHIMDGTAEDTGLPDKSVDFIVVGQAFHWFEFEQSKKEFSRILKDGGVLVLVWNNRVPKKTGLNHAYENICKKYSSGYHTSGSTVMEEGTIVKMFGKDSRRFVIPNPQQMDLEGLKGRYFSTSYALKKGHAKYKAMLKALEKAFQENSKNGFVTMEYETRVYAGRLSPK